MKEMLKDKKILVATTPAMGCFNSLSGLAKYLKETGNDVRWYTSSDFSGKLDDMDIPHYPFERAIDLNFSDIESFFPERPRIEGSMERMNFDTINLFTDRAEEYFRDIQKISEDFHFDLVICDSFFSAVPVLKSEMDAKVVLVGVTPLAEVSVDLAPFGTGLLPAENVVQRFKYGLMRFIFRKLTGRKSIRSFQQTLEPFGVSDTDTPFLDLIIKKADLYLQIGSPSLEYTRRDLGSNVRYVGALGPAQGKLEGRWYDERLKRYKNIVLLTQGSLEKNLDGLIIPALEAFRGSRDILLIVTTGGNQTQLLRDRYNFDNVIVEDYIQYRDIMPYAHVYLTNGGYGGVIESLRCGLPMVTAGLFGAKKEVCSRIAHFKFGIALKTGEFSSRDVKKAVLSVLENSAYRENVKRIATEFENIYSEELSAHYINECLSYGADGCLPISLPEDILAPGHQFA